MLRERCSEKDDAQHPLVTEQSATEHNRFHLILTEYNKNGTIASTGKSLEKSKPSYIASGNTNCEEKCW